MPDERLRILVIDDDGDLTTSVAAVLEANGYEVLTATDGEQGLELAFTGHPHLILLDVTMPGMDGHQVCRELQFGYTKDIPVVFLTARTELAHMMEANRSGASAYVTKPFQSGAPAADHPRRPPRRQRVPRRRHGPPHARRRPGRDPAHAVRPRPARRSST